MFYHTINKKTQLSISLQISSTRYSVVPVPIEEEMNFIAISNIVRSIALVLIDVKFLL